MSKLLFISIFIFGLVLGTNAQTSVFSKYDSILVEIDPILGKHYKHQIKANQTIYRLAKFFGTSVSEIYSFNEMEPPYTLDIGQYINIPFSAKVLLKSSQRSNYDHMNLLPVFYSVTTGDNLYRISTIYFDQEVDQLMNRNKLNTSELALDQRLLVGWIPLPATIEEKSIVRFKKMIAPFTLEETDVAEAPRKNIIEVQDSKEIAVDSTPILIATETSMNEELATNIPIDSSEIALAFKNKLYNQDSVQLIIQSEKGIAIWNKEHRDQENLFVLHRTAKVNSIIELNYPLLHRTAFAKVVGNIPSGMYPEDVSLIISPKVAQSLGARDTRFAIEMKYYE